MKSSVKEVPKEAKVQRVGAVSGRMLNWRRRTWGIAVEKIWGRVWYRPVGSQSLLGRIKEGRRFRLLKTPRGGCDAGETIRRVRTKSRGDSRRPLRQLASPITTRLAIGEGESERSSPVVPAPAELVIPGVNPPFSFPLRSGSPNSASSIDLRNESVVLKRIEYRNVQLVALHRPTAPDVSYRTDMACMTESPRFIKSLYSASGSSRLLRELREGVGVGSGDGEVDGGDLRRFLGDRLRGALDVK
jgi:hypothetical protein